MSEALLLAVLPIILSADQQLTASEIFKLVSDAAELRPSLRVMSIDQYYFHEGGELANNALACGSDTACIASQLAPFEAQLGMVVIANLEIDPPLLSILLLDTENRSVIGESTAAAKEIRPSILERSSALLDAAGLRRSGRLVVQVVPPHALIAIEGARPDIGATDRFTLVPGSYTIAASAAGYEASSLLAEVRSGETQSVSLTLVEKTSIVESPWFWIIGSAVIVAVGATATAFALRGSRSCVCVLTSDGRDCSVCE